MAPLLLGITLSLVPAAYAQYTTDKETDVKNACKKAALDQGWTIQGLGAVSPDAKDKDKVPMVYSLGEQKNLNTTCQYDEKTKKATFVSEKAKQETTKELNKATAAEDLFNPWGWLLVPIVLAVPFFLKRKEPAYNTGAPSVAERSGHYDGIIENRGNRVNVHNRPNANSDIVGALEDGQRIALSGRQDNNWSELSDGGWIPTRSLKSRIK